MKCVCLRSAKPIGKAGRGPLDAASFRRQGRTICLASEKPDVKVDQPDPGMGLKALWVAAEQFGNFVGASKGQTSVQSTAQVGKLSREAVIAGIKDDYEKNYFISGAGEMTAYAEDCLYSDPFVSFRGTQRFKQNVSNFANVLQDVKLDIYEFDEKDNEITAKWRFSCIIDLPWKPRIAARGNTTHVIDVDSGRVVAHVERWDVDPNKVIAQLFKPAAKVPANAWETFFLAASDKDVKGMWWATSPLVLKISAPIVGISLIHKAITGEGLPGLFLGSLEGLSFLGLASAAITEVVKFAQGMQGGDSGTGGRF